MNTKQLNFEKHKIEEILGTVASPSIVISELIKNSLDSNATTITINIDTGNNCITVQDNGDGFSLSDIHDLSNIGESRKKETTNLKRTDGHNYAGSKGLGLLSSFSLANQLEILTVHGNKIFNINWIKSTGSYQYTELKTNPSSLKKGSIIILKNISTDSLRILTDVNEYKKLRHVRLNNFKRNPDELKIEFKINNQIQDEINCTNILDLEKDFKYRVDFKYNSLSNSLSFNFQLISPAIDSQIEVNLAKNTLDSSYTIQIPLNNNINIINILKNQYNISSYVSLQPYQFNYLSSKLEEFEGSIWISRGRKKGKGFSEIGYGVKVFVNDYAIYNYLDNDNDWLNFSQASQLRKTTNLKLHNVYGYINFPDFNDKSACLKISNERAGFIENSAYKKFIEIIKYIIVELSFQIDVALKNNHIKPIKNINSIQNASTTPTSITPTSITPTSTTPTSTTPTSTTPASITPTSITPTSITPTSITPTSITPTSITPTSTTPTSTTPATLNNYSPVIKYKKRSSCNFFKESSVLKITPPPLTQYNEITTQLLKLNNYSDYYCLYIVAFRVILEDICKRYLNKRNISLENNLGQNIYKMTNDMLSTISDKTLIDFHDKKSIENLLGGYNALKDYLIDTGFNFYKDGKSGAYANKLNSHTHNPRCMLLEEAETIANNIIVPLYVLSNQILEHIKEQ
ncbi:ATP-binding protein [Turicibacter sanguinis]|nr:ATP-binding protein [Turicibacter sanguinis]MCU7201594.1 ATP-binding protein [Turicibacter sanguinis]